MLGWSPLWGCCDWGNIRIRTAIGPDFRIQSLTGEFCDKNNITICFLFAGNCASAMVERSDISFVGNPNRGMCLGDVMRGEMALIVAAELPV